MPKDNEHTSIEKQSDETVDLTQEDTVNEENEKKYQESIKLKKCINCMTLSNEKPDMYLKAAQRFSEISGYKDADAYEEECRKLADQVTEQIKEVTYDRALNIKMAARSAAEYKLAAEDFKKIGSYRDAESFALECESMRDNLERKAYYRGLVNKGIVLLLIVAALLGITSPYARYYAARTLTAAGSYNSAINIYNHLGTFKDSEERIVKCQYLSGLKLETKGEYKSARTAFAASRGYKDSDEKKVQMEKRIIKDSTVGNTVTIGDSKWIIMELQNDKALLLKKTALTGISYNNTLENVTWESSDIRQYLNTEFYSTAFSETEKNNIIDTNIINDDNSYYGTEGGKDTRDYIFLLSIAEAQNYKNLLKNIKNMNWLRSPGKAQDAAAFIYTKGEVMDYGYAVNSEDITILPALWFNLNG